MKVNIQSVEQRELAFCDLQGNRFPVYDLQVVDHSASAVVSIQPGRIANLMLDSSQPDISNDPPATGPGDETWTALLTAAEGCSRQNHCRLLYCLFGTEHRLPTHVWDATHFQTTDPVIWLRHSIGLMNAAPPVHFRNQAPCSVTRFQAKDLVRFRDSNVSDQQNCYSNVRQLLADTLTATEDYGPPFRPSPGEFLEKLAFNPDPLTVFTATEEDRTVGILAMDMQSEVSAGHIEYLGVASDCRRSGIATGLLKTASNDLPKDDLSVAVRSRNTASMRFFSQLGFQESERYSMRFRELLPE